MSDTILISTRKGLFEAARADGGWAVEASHFLGDNVTLAHVDQRDGTVYAALDHGHFGVKLHRRAPGSDWEEVGVPAYPPRPDDATDKTHTGTPLPWSLSRIWSLANDTVQEGALWCGTIPGGLFRSEDRGDSWTLVESLWRHPDRSRWMGGGADYPGIHSILVDPDAPAHVLVGVSCGGVWETCDGGETWTVRASGMQADFMPPELADDPVVQDPHLVVACPADFRRMYTQHHCGIWASRDGARSWQRVERAGPSTFGFAVAVHPTDPDTAWFVPAIADQKRIPVDGAVVVTRTRDGGESFETLTEGLPQRHAYDLVYRHALDVSTDGARLCFGSTTGSVWISESSGDRWLQLSGHLPPVYAVTFA